MKSENGGKNKPKDLEHKANDHLYVFNNLKQ